jgi:hypothetical protein
MNEYHYYSTREYNRGDNRQQSDGTQAEAVYLFRFSFSNLAVSSSKSGTLLLEVSDEGGVGKSKPPLVPVLLLFLSVGGEGKSNPPDVDDEGGDGNTGIDELAVDAVDEGGDGKSGIDGVLLEGGDGNVKALE